MLGESPDDIALAARAQYRTQGLTHLALPATPVVLEVVQPRLPFGCPLVEDLGCGASDVSSLS